MESANRLVADAEVRLQDIPRKDEVEEMRKVVEKMADDLNASKAETAELKGKAILLFDQSNKVAVLQGVVAHLEGQLGRTSEKAAFLLEESVGALKQSHDLLELNRVLEVELNDLNGARDAELRAALRSGWRDLADEFDVILHLISDKFKRKEGEITAEIHLHELHANIQLLEALTKRSTTVEEEREKLIAQQPQFEKMLKSGKVSDFSISKLPLSQISEDSIAVAMDVDQAAHDAEGPVELVEPILEDAEAPGATGDA